MLVPDLTVDGNAVTMGRMLMNIPVGKYFGAVTIYWADGKISTYLESTFEVEL